MAYVTKLQLETYLKRNLTENEEAFLVILAPAIKRWIDAKLSTTFDPVEPSTRTYDGNCYELDIDPVQDITAVSNINSDGSVSYTYSTGTEIIYEPANATIKRSVRNIYNRGKFPKG